MITMHECIVELQRELAVRKRVYPRWQEDGKLTAEQAAHRIDVIETILRVYERMHEAHEQSQTDLFP